MRVNGKEIPLKKPQTLQEFLLEQGYRLALIAVEHNDKERCLLWKPWKRIR